MSMSPGVQAKLSLLGNRRNNLRYYPAAADGRKHTCAIIARVSADGVRAVAVRRDPRL
jgi:hypothetical protein